MLFYLYFGPTFFQKVVLKKCLHATTASGASVRPMAAGASNLASAGSAGFGGGASAAVGTSTASFHCLSKHFIYIQKKIIFHKMN